MPRYIDGTALLNKYNSKNMTVNEMYQTLVEQPTADVVEVKRGKWLNIIFTQRYECSLCGNEIYFGKAKFCSECGAKMDGTLKERDGTK